MSATGPLDLIGKSPGGRKLIAVVHADMVDYSRLIGLDDAGTIERLRRLRSELIDPAIDEHGGKVVQTAGDSLLIVFDSIDGAVRCAVKVQQQVPIHDGDQPPDRAIRFRVGINIGDAIADGTDLHGDAVNVAARIQAECPPGRICVTRAVRDHVHGRLGLEFDELGPRGLKNIARPVEAFLLRPDTSATTPRPVEQALAGGVNLPLSDKPSIAVLPFVNWSGDLEQEYFSDGVADDIITGLSRCHSLFVIARNSSFTYRGRSIDVRLVARELGVRYVMEGSVRHSDVRVRVAAQLTDAATGNHIWAERYDRALEDVFAVQDEITMAVVSAIVPAVADAELRRALRKPPGNLGAWEAYQRGLWHLSQHKTEDIPRAREFLNRALEQDPTLAAAHIGLAELYALEGGVSPRAHSRKPRLWRRTKPARRSISIRPMPKRMPTRPGAGDTSATTRVASIMSSRHCRSTRTARPLTSRRLGCWYSPHDQQRGVRRACLPCALTHAAGSPCTCEATLRSATIWKTTMKMPPPPPGACWRIVPTTLLHIGGWPPHSANLAGLMKPAMRWTRL
jgi:TolB-like protein/class 3 adenylate cyclase